MSDNYPDGHREPSEAEPCAFCETMLKERARAERLEAALRECEAGLDMTPCRLGPPSCLSKKGYRCIRCEALRLARAALAPPDRVVETLEATHSDGGVSRLTITEPAREVTDPTPTEVECLTCGGDGEVLLMRKHVMFPDPLNPGGDVMGPCPDCGDSPPLLDGVNVQEEES